MRCTFINYTFLRDSVEYITKFLITIYEVLQDHLSTMYFIDLFKPYIRLISTLLLFVGFLDAISTLSSYSIFSRSISL